MPKKPTKPADPPSVEAAYIIMDAMDDCRMAHIRLKDNAHIAGNVLLIATTDPDSAAGLPAAKSGIKAFRKMRDAYQTMARCELHLVCELDFLDAMDADRLDRMREIARTLKAAHRRFLEAQTQVKMRHQAYRAAVAPAKEVADGG